MRADKAGRGLRPKTHADLLRNSCRKDFTRLHGAVKAVKGMVRGAFEKLPQAVEWKVQRLRAGQEACSDLRAQRSPPQFLTGLDVSNLFEELKPFQRMM